MISDLTIIKRNSSLKPIYADDNLNMLNIETGKYAVLNSVGAMIWNYTEIPITVKDIVIKLTEEFDVSHDECSKSVILYLENLLKERLIDVV